MIVVHYGIPHELFLSSEDEEVVVGMYGGFVGSRICVVKRFLEVRNSSPSPEMTFQVRKGDLPRIDDLVGFMHSHPNAPIDPSDEDLQGLPKGMIGAVWQNGELCWYGHKDRDSVWLAIDRLEVA